MRVSQSRESGSVWTVPNTIAKSFLFFLFILLPITALGQYYAVVDANVPANGCPNAWPAEILGNYAENGTNNGRACYEGPSGYWLYHAVMTDGFGGTIGNAWVVGKPLGSTNINGANIRHYYLGSSTTPPLNTNFTYSSNGCGTVKIQVGSAPPPAAPTLTNPANVTATAMDLYWNQINNATNYRIDVSTSSSFSSFVSPYNSYATPTGTPYAPTSFHLTGLSPGITYYIRIRSENGSGQSANSNTVNATTIPSAPSATAATPIDHQSFQANWNTQAGASYYRLYVSLNSGFSSHISGFNGATVYGTSHVVSGLASNTTYYYRLRAVNSSGTSGYSNVISTVAGPPVPVIAPPTGITNSGFTAHWGTSSGATGYRLDVSANSGFSSFVTGYNNRDMGTATSGTLSGLTAGTTYYYRVRAYNATSPSGNSASESAALVPPAPVTTSAGDLTQDSFTANWNAASGATGYRLDVATDITFSTYVSGFQNLDVGNNLSQSVTGLSPYTLYYYRVRAYNASGTSGNSNTTSARTEGALGAATTQAVSAIADKTATGNGTVTDMGVPSATEHGMVWNTSGTPQVPADAHTSRGTPSLGTFSSAMTGLLPDTTYHVRAYVTNPVGPAYGNEVTFTTLAPSLSIAITPSTTNGNCGSDATWTVIVTNNGAVNADVILLEVTPGAWLDPNAAASSPGHADLGGGTFAWEFNNLGSGASQSFTLAATLNPDGYPTQADCTDTLRQINVRTNWGAGTTGDAVDGNPATRGYDKINGTWSVTGAATVNMPNLIATAITPSSTCTGDGNLSGTITVTIQNTGTAPATGPFTVQVTDGKGWTGTGTYPGTLAFGASDTVDINTGSWPVSCHDCADPYTLNATVDLNNDVCECNESDNDYGPVSYAVELPDLSVTGDTLSITCSGDGEAEVSGTLTIANTACGDFSGDIPVQFTVYDDTDCMGTVRGQWTEILTGVSVSGNGSLPAPASGQKAPAIGTTTVSISPHTWSLAYFEHGDSCQVSVTVDLDVGDTICECDGSNNSYCATPLDIGIPDLQPFTDGLSVNLTSENTLTVTGHVTVVNWGCVPVNTNLDVRFTVYAGDNQAAPMVDQWTETFTGMNITGNSGTQPITLTAHDIVLVGGIPDDACELSVFVELDYTHAICETSGINNDYLYTGFAITAPDLEVIGQVLEITCDSSGPDTVSGTVTLANTGCGPLNGDVELAFTLSDDATCTGTVLYAWSEVFSSLDVPAGGTIDLLITPASAELSVCGQTEPRASVLTVVDPGNGHAELDGNNNTFCGEISLQHTITATAGANGTITPSGLVLVNHGLDQSFEFTADPGYHVDYVVIDGLERNARRSYTFPAVTEDHAIHVAFMENIPPVIDSFTRDTETGNVPLVVTFEATAHDPDGGRIERYEWQFSGPETTSRTTSDGNLAFRFLRTGTWMVTLTVFDDENETATSEPMEIIISDSGPLAIPIPVPSDADKMKLYESRTISWVVNPFETPSTVRLFSLDDTGETYAQADLVVPGNGKQMIDPATHDTEAAALIAETDRHLLFATTIQSPFVELTAPLSDNLASRLYIPHIAEDTVLWDTSAYISMAVRNANLFGRFSVGGVFQDILMSPVEVLDMESLLAGTGEMETGWGSFSSEARDPFSDTRVLSGFELFVKDGDGAAVGLQGHLFKTLYIPHIPTAFNRFWTGFAMINPGTEPVNITARLYTDTGELVNTYALAIPAGTKKKGLLDDFFPESRGIASWGIITADQPIAAVEIYGVFDGGICGFSLPGMQVHEASLPGIALDGDHWTGIAMANPGAESTTVTLTLRSGDGQVKATKSLDIQPRNRTAMLLTDLFPGVELLTGDHVRLSATAAVLAVEVVGNNETDMLMALPALD